MKQYVCAKCEKTVGADEMNRYPSGAISKICTACHDAKAKKRGGSKPAKAEAAAIETSAAAPALKIEAGFGIQAELENGYLKLIQADQDGKLDTVIVSRSEAILLFATFGDWARS